MKRKTIKKLVLENIYLLIPLVLYGIYKNGYLVYSRNLLAFSNIFKPLYLILIGVIIKFIVDIIFYKKFKIDYNLLYTILIAMIMPSNINYLVFTIGFLIFYIASLYLDKYFKINKVCLIYVLLILVNSIFNEFTFANNLELKYSFSYNFFDLLMGRNIGGISSSSIFFSLMSFSFLIYSIYYKKEIPFVINITYLLLAFIYFFITNDNSLLLNSEVIFASIFVCTLPLYSPTKFIKQILYGISIGIITFIISLFNSVISIYVATLIVSIIINILLKVLKKPKINRIKS